MAEDEPNLTSSGGSHPEPRPSHQDGNQKRSVKDSDYSCCAGITYYNKRMQDNGQVPLCLGVRRVKQGLPKADELQRLPGDISSYHFGCLGYSAHFKQQPLDGSSGIIIPYCEGIELISVEEATSMSPEESEEGASAVSGRIMLHQSKGGDVSSSGAEPDASSSSPSSTTLTSVTSDTSSRKAAAAGSTPTMDDGAHSPTGGGGFQQRFLDKAMKNIAAMRGALHGGPVGVGGERGQSQSYAPSTELVEKLWQTGSRNAGMMGSAAITVSKAVSDILTAVVKIIASPGRAGRGSDKERDR